MLLHRIQQITLNDTDIKIEQIAIANGYNPNPIFKKVKKKLNKNYQISYRHVILQQESTMYIKFTYYGTITHKLTMKYHTKKVKTYSIK